MKILVLLDLIWITYLFQNVSGADESYLTDKAVAEGLIYPNEKTTFIGHDLTLKMRSTFQNQEKCTFRRPKSLVDIDVNSLEGDSQIIKLELEDCGIRIKNITKQDGGYWRLTSQRGNEVSRGIALIEISENLPEYNSVVKRRTVRSHRDFAPEKTSYCYVYRPNSKQKRIQSEFPSIDDCEIPELSMDPEANGEWNVRLGMEDNTEEIELKILVENNPQKLITSVERPEGKSLLILKCNLDNYKTETTIKYCRFSRVSDSYALNMVEGQGNSKYIYYGSGFSEGQCGMMITDADRTDNSLWKCFLGTENEKNVKRTFGAIVDATDPPIVEPYLKGDDVYRLIKKPLNILCESEIAIQYCWFKDPNGRLISITDEVIESGGRSYWYFGNGLQLGHCGITIKESGMSDNGTWSCNVGYSSKAQHETTKEIQVRITETNLAANAVLLNVEENENLMIECASIPPNTPLEYCRFHLPTGEAFSIDNSVTSKNAIDDKYFFNSNHKLETGYCSIVVKSASKDNQGTWTCAGRLLGWNEESYDVIEIIIIENGLSTASIIGMTVGIVFVVVAILTIAIHRYRKLRNRPPEEESIEL